MFFPPHVVIPHKKLRTDSKLKYNVQFENYVIVLKNVKERRNRTRLRISASNVNIEKVKVKYASEGPKR